MKALEDNHKFGFVILHYNSVEDTKKCVDSIQKKLSDFNVEIVIVDNFSPNKSGEELVNLYKNEEHISVIINGSNLGFAKGNNIGFKFAKSELNCDFICMMNNDTEILQKDFISLIVEEYKKSNFAVLGPKIILNNNAINPLYLNLPEIKRLKNDYNDLKKMKLLNDFYLLKLIYWAKDKISKPVLSQASNVDEYHENIILHGCCWIFSPTYVSLFDGIDDRTFMFREEEFLYLRLEKNNLKNVYNPNVLIRHYEDGSTNHTYKNYRDKTKFTIENQLKSTELLINELERISDKSQ